MATTSCFIQSFTWLSSSSLSIWYRLFFQMSRSSCRLVPISFPDVMPIFLRSWPLTGKRGTDHLWSSVSSFTSPWYFSSSHTLLWESGSRLWAVRDITDMTYLQWIYIKKIFLRKTRFKWFKLVKASWFYWCAFYQRFYTRAATIQYSSFGRYLIVFNLTNIFWQI